MKFKKTLIGYKGRNTYTANSNGYTVGGSVTYSTSDTNTNSSTKAISTKASAEGENAASNSVNSYSLTSFETKENDKAGHWNASVWYANSLYDGLTIAIRNTTTCFQNNEGYNTLNINKLGAKLVWKDYGVPLNQELKAFSEIILVYREDAGLFNIPNPNTGELESDTIPTGNTVSSGWVIVSGLGGNGSGSGADLSNYYTKQQTNTVIEESINNSIKDFCKVSVLTLAEYQALAVKDPKTFYIIHNQA